MIAVGKGTVEPWPKPGQLSYDEVVVDNRFSWLMIRAMSSPTNNTSMGAYDERGIQPSPR